jgi:hypothetical protein
MSKVSDFVNSLSAEENVECFVECLSYMNSQNIKDAVERMAINENDQANTLHDEMLNYDWNDEE